MARIYSKDEKLQAAAIYVVTGRQDKAAEAIGAGRCVVHAWISRGDEDWLDAVARAQEVYDETIPHQLAGHMTRALEVMTEKLPEATASQAATIYGILFDKRQIAMNRPTSITGKRDDAERRLSEIAAKLESKTKPAKAA